MSFIPSAQPTGTSGDHNRLRNRSAGDAHPQLAPRDHKHPEFAREGHIHGAVAKWIPRVEQGGSDRVDTASTEAFYTDDGIRVGGFARIAFASSGTAGSRIEVYGDGLPSARASGSASGQFIYFDGGAVWHVGNALMPVASGILWRLYVNGTSDSMGIDPSFAISATDALYFDFSYIKAEPT